MKNKWIAGILNFFTLGLGTLYLGKRKLFGFLMFLGAGLLAYVEFSLGTDHELYWYSFGGFLLLAIATTIDAVHETKMINGMKSGMTDKPQE